MDNRFIAKQFDLIAKLLELQNQNPFRIRTYTNAYNAVSRNELPLIDMDFAVLTSLPGIGKTLAQHIVELRENGTIKILDELIRMTPPGILDILKIKGLGAKKIALIWNELGVESLGELEYACLENRLTTLKGFGEKTQQDVLKQIDFLKKSKDSVLLHVGLGYGQMILEQFKAAFPDGRFELAGSLKRKMEVISEIDILGTIESESLIPKLVGYEMFSIHGKQMLFNNIPIHYSFSSIKGFDDNLFEKTLPESLRASNDLDLIEYCRLIPPECQDLIQIMDKRIPLETALIEETDIQGVIHAHSRWSDGSNTIEDMAKACQSLGYKYLVITDHSASAFYANGLSELRVEQQWKEIDEINKSLTDFKIYKGIESDILTDGRLDYSEALLSGFDMVIASVHSVLKMDERTATDRLIKAIEHPATKVLGHLTGRLLLSREGYPVDHIKIIDACAVNRVAIEINSNPHRLDIDWRWLPYAMNKGVDICISPDAHNIAGIEDIIFGVWMARKGGIVKNACINTKDRVAFENWLNSK
jgi:DNA polymerase (family X)